MMNKQGFLALLCAVILGAAGCASKHIVRAAPPSVSSPPPEEIEPMPQPAETPAPATTVAEPPPAEPAPAPPLVPAKRPAPPRPRPSQPENADSAPPKPAAPLISPQLSARDLAATKTNTTNNLMTAERNLQLAAGRQLNPAQKDLADKISGFLADAHGAISADDWVRAQNLAEKARVLSVELTKSF
jgi:outer membrane biosynthesis protein TonB